MRNVRAKKYLGQHFLSDLDVAQRIVSSLSLEEEMHVLEVGAGMGVLTQFLLKEPLAKLQVVEIDTESIRYLRVHFPTLPMIEGDFLQLDLSSIYTDKFCVIGNFPYNISSQIFFKALEHKDQIPMIVGMLQKEVAERLTSPPGRKSYGILSVFLQAYYKPEYLFTVSEEVFDPPPKVKSAVVRFTRNDVVSLECDEKLFRRVVKMAFNQRRKTMRNSLASLVPKGHAIFKETIFGERPEKLDVNQFVVLTNKIEEVLRE